MPKSEQKQERQPEMVGEGTINVPQEDFLALVSEVKALRAKVETASVTNTVAVDDDAPKVRTATVRLYEGRPISDVSNVINTRKLENDGSEIMTCDITFVDAGGQYQKATVNYLDMIRSWEQETCVITEVIDIPVRVRPKNSPDRIETVKMGEFSGMKTGIFVPNRVVLHDITYVVDFRGEKVQLKAVNI